MDNYIESNDLLDDPVALRKRMRDEGYLFLRDFLPRKEVLGLRRQIAGICRDAGWLIEGSDPILGLTNRPWMREGAAEWKPVYAKVQALEGLHRMKLHPRVQRIMDDLFEEPSFALPLTVARMAFPGTREQMTPAHQDWLYIGGSTEIITCWVPLGDVPQCVGGLKVLPGSHKAGFLAPKTITGLSGNRVEVELDPTLGWCTADYRAGDLLLFKALTVHAGVENQTPDHMRYSMDFRYAGVSHTITEHCMKPDQHWQGEPFSWETLEKDWRNSPTAHYWQRLPRIKTKMRDVLWKQ